MNEGVDESEDPGYRTPRLPILGIVVLLVVAFVAAIAIVVAISGEAEPFVPAGDFGEVTVLSSEAAEELAELAPAAVLERCLDGDGDACLQQQENARAAQGRMRELAFALEELEPPARAQEWHAEYIDAIRELSGALGAQASAIEGRDLAAFESAVERTREAVAAEVALNDRFNVEFADAFRDGG